MGDRFAALLARLRALLGTRDDGGDAGVPLRRRDLRSLRQGRAGMIVLAALLVVCLGLVAAVVLKTRSDAVVAAREASSYSPPAATAGPAGTARTPDPTAGPTASGTATSPTTGSSGPLVAVVGDSVTVSAAGGTGPLWPQLAAKPLRARMQTTGAAATGYVAGAGTGAAQGTFAQRAARIDPHTRLVVFVGGVHDAGTAQVPMLMAATRAYAVASMRASGARIVVIGPVWPTAEPPAKVQVVRDALQRSAAIAGATWIDPISRGWVQDGRLSADGRTLTAAGQRELAADLVPVLQPLLPARG